MSDNESPTEGLTSGEDRRGQVGEAKADGQEADGWAEGSGVTVSASDPQQRQAGRELTIGLSARETDTVGECGGGRGKPPWVGDGGVELPSAISAQRGAWPRDPKESTWDLGKAMEPHGQGRACTGGDGERGNAHGQGNTSMGGAWFCSGGDGEHVEMGGRGDCVVPLGKEIVAEHEVPKLCDGGAGWGGSDWGCPQPFMLS